MFLLANPKIMIVSIRSQVTSQVQPCLIHDHYFISSEYLGRSSETIKYFRNILHFKLFQIVKFADFAFRVHTDAEYIVRSDLIAFYVKNHVFEITGRHRMVRTYHPCIGVANFFKIIDRGSAKGDWQFSRCREDGLVLLPDHWFLLQTALVQRPGSETWFRPQAQ